MSKKPRLGIMFRREYPPEKLPDFARRTEALGFDELWVVEDCFYASGIASAATALACTSTLQVGLGIMPAVARNPVFAAMEIATLARLYPGRFLPGFGHGVADWMRQIGAFPRSQLRALEEVTLTVRRLLAGERVTFHGQHVQLEAAQLILPPTEIPPISLGVIGPKSLALVGRCADGVILSEYSAPAYVGWAKEQITAGQRAVGQPHPYRLTVFAFACAESTTAAARTQLRPMLREALAYRDLDPKLAATGILDEVQALRDAGTPLQENDIADAWIDQMAIVGTPADWRAAIERYAAFDMDALILTPLPHTDVDVLEQFAKHL